MKRFAIMAAAFGALAATLSIAPANAFPVAPAKAISSDASGTVQAVRYRDGYSNYNRGHGNYNRGHGGGVRMFFGGRRHGGGYAYGGGHRRNYSWGYGRRGHGYGGYGGGHGRRH